MAKHSRSTKSQRSNGTRSGPPIIGEEVSQNGDGVHKSSTQMKPSNQSVQHLGEIVQRQSL